MGSYPSWLRRHTVNMLAMATACSTHAYPTLYIREGPTNTFRSYKSREYSLMVKFFSVIEADAGSNPVVLVSV